MLDPTSVATYPREPARIVNLIRAAICARRE